MSPVRNEDFETSVPGVHVVGDAAGLGGARAAMAEGVIAGAAAAQACGKTPDRRLMAEVKASRKQLSGHRTFQRALWRIYGVPKLMLQFCTDDTLVCRCEEVTLGRLKSLAAAENDIGNIKRQCRAGMGRCQGRYCSHVIQHLLADLWGGQVEEHSGWAPRMPFKPVPIRSLAIDQEPAA